MSQEKPGVLILREAMATGDALGLSPAFLSALLRRKAGTILTAQPQPKALTVSLRHKTGTILTAQPQP
ncbi:MAG: hypothetical protein IKN57_12120 [Parasporobacterium sp.]|nr:hypothetical protein [Parasporobacterium sp.]